MSVADTQAASSPAVLVAIIRAAHIAGDHDLERSAKAELADRFGMTVAFKRNERRREPTR